MLILRDKPFEENDDVSGASLTRGCLGLLCNRDEGCFLGPRGKSHIRDHSAIESQTFRDFL